MDDDDENTLSADQLQGLTEGLEAALKELKETRSSMQRRNEEVAKLLERQKTLEKDANENGEALKEIKSNLVEQATALETLAKRHTELVETTRSQMKNLGSATEESDRAFVAPNGTIWESRQQALETGMFFMATMARDGHAKQGARRWLKEHASSLRWLPRIPKSFVEEFGAKFTESVTRMARYDDLSNPRLLQDLTGGATPGSILVRPQFSNALIRNVEQYSAFRRYATIWPMGSDTVYIPRRKSGLEIYWEGEGEAGTETDPVYELLGMTAKKMIALHQFSSELSEDACIELASEIMLEFALRISKEEDRIGFLGDGSGGNSPNGYAGYVGVLGADANADEDTANANAVPHLIVGAATNDLTSEITEAKLRAMTGRLPTWAEFAAHWFMSKSVHADLDGIQMGTSGGSVVRYQEGRSPRIMGDTIVHVQVMPRSPSEASTKVLAYGDLRKSWILGDRRAVQVQTSEDYAFNTDQLTMRVTARAAFKMKQGNGMVVYKTGTES